MGKWNETCGCTHFHPIQPSTLCAHQEGVPEGESKESEVRPGDEDKDEGGEEAIAAGWRGRELAVDSHTRSSRMLSLLAPISERNVTRVAEKHGAPPSPEGDDNVETISAQAFGDVAAECSHDWRLPRVLTPRCLSRNDEHAEHGQQTLVQSHTHSSEHISPRENIESEVSLTIAERRRRRGGGRGGEGLAHENKESEVSALPSSPDDLDQKRKAAVLGCFGTRELDGAAEVDSEDTPSESEHTYLTSQEIQHMHERVNQWLSSAPPLDDNVLVAQSSYSGKGDASPVHSPPNALRAHLSPSLQSPLQLLLPAAKPYVPIHHVPVQTEVSQGKEDGIEGAGGCEGQEAAVEGEEGADCHGMGMEARSFSSEETVTLVNSPPNTSQEHTVREGLGVGR